MCQKAEEDLRYDLTDCIFNIPFRAETQDRLDNINIVIDYLLHHFHARILICESGKKSILAENWKKEWQQSVRLLFVQENEDRFHKTKLLNIMARASDSEFIISHDADIIIPPTQYMLAHQIISQKNYYFCFPFNNNIVHIPKEKFQRLINMKFNLDKAGLGINVTQANKRNHLLSDGGCLFMNKKEFMDIGMENERYVNYNFEDAERRLRIQKLGYDIKYAPGYFYHLEHRRTVTSNYGNKHYEEGRKMYTDLKTMTKKDVEKQIKDFEWRNIQNNLDILWD